MFLKLLFVFIINFNFLLLISFYLVITTEMPGIILGKILNKISQLKYVL